MDAKRSEVCEECGACGGDDIAAGRQSMQRALRSVRANKKSIFGKPETFDFEEIARNIRQNGPQYNASTLRNSIIGGLEIRPKKGSAENLILTGCASFGTAVPLRAYGLLLQKLGVDYVFLEKEYCCGSPLLSRTVVAGSDRSKADATAKEFLGLNLNDARQRGVKNMLYFCQWCAYLAKRFYSDSGINQMLAADILLDQLDGHHLRLEGKVAYFNKRAHRQPIYDPEQIVKLNWGGYRSLLNRVEGLEVVDVPDYCCQVAPKAIFDWAREAGTDTLVVTCISCYGNLVRKAPKMAPGLRVKHLYSVLLSALEQDKRLLEWV